MAKLLQEAPDNLVLNNLQFSFRTPPFLSFHIITGVEQRFAFYTIDKVHLHLINPLKTFLVETLGAHNFVEVRHNRYLDKYSFNLSQFNELTEKAKQMLKSQQIEYVELGNKKFSIYDLFYFVDAYNSPKKVYLGGRMWDRARLVNSQDDPINIPACSMYQLEYGDLDMNVTKASLLKIIKAAHDRSEMFNHELVTNKMAIEYKDSITYLDISPALS